VKISGHCTSDDVYLICDMEHPAACGGKISKGGRRLEWPQHKAGEVANDNRSHWRHVEPVFGVDAGDDPFNDHAAAPA
jgi:hypothetical protein